MPRLFSSLIIAMLLAALSLPHLASSQTTGAKRPCLQEIRKLCGTARDRDVIKKCVREKFSQLSKSCQSKIRERAKTRQNKTSGNSSSNHSQLAMREYSYGTQQLQKLDFYPAVTAKPAPLVIFVHGGAWNRGSKGASSDSTKAAYFRSAGYAFASVNYRLVPDASVEQQASDIADAIKWLKERQGKFNIDGNNIVLMGHSAGAHLAALVGTDPRYLRQAGLTSQSLSGVILLDGAAYHVPTQMAGENRLLQSSYRQAFGQDRERQLALSPTHHAKRPGAPAFLILHVDRKSAAEQSARLANQLSKADGDVQLRAVDGKNFRGHMEINRRLGDPDYPATLIVSRWLSRIFA